MYLCLSIPYVFCFWKLPSKKNRKCWLFPQKRGGGQVKKVWIFKGRGGLGQIYTLFKIFLFKKNFVLFHPVFGVGGRIFGLINMTFSLFLLSNVLSIPPSKVRIPLTSLKNFKFFWVGRSFSGENWRQFFPPKCVLTPKDHFERDFYFFLS